VMKISVIVGSTRPDRFSEKPAQWILQQLQKREGIEAQLLDLRDFPMPFFDQPLPPAIPVGWTPASSRICCDATTSRNATWRSRSCVIAGGCAIPQLAGAPDGADEDQSERAADGDRHHLQQTEIAHQAVCSHSCFKSEERKCRNRSRACCS